MPEDPELMKNLRDNLRESSKNIFDLPLVLQYNKRDLIEKNIPILPVERMEKILNSKLKVPSFEASALKGNNVVKTLKKITSMTMESLQNLLQ